MKSNVLSGPFFVEAHPSHGFVIVNNSGKILARASTYNAALQYAVTLVT